MKLLFIRHAETEINIKGLMHKVDDPELLSLEGVRQAERLIIPCAEYKIEAIFSSPEKRAIETAEIVAKKLNIENKVIEEFCERNWGDWSEKPWEEVKKILDPMTLDERYDFAPPNGESWRKMNERLLKGLGILITMHYEAVAIVTHGGALRALMPILKNAPKDSSFQYDFANASITVFEYNGKAFDKVKVNDVSHLN